MEDASGRGGTCGTLATMPFLDTTELEQHFQADAAFGPCHRPGCPNYAEPNITSPPD